MQAQTYEELQDIFSVSKRTLANWKAKGCTELAEPPYLQGVIDAIGTLFCNETVLAMWHRSTEISDSELAALGFRRIAGSELIYRHSALRSDFSDEHPSGMDVPFDFEAEKSDEEWVLREWDKVAH
jgi:hypothetical protein